MRDYQWTLDKMTELARLASYDVNGNAEVDSGDRFGLDCSTFAWQPLFYGTGSSMITKDENDIPHLSWDSEHNLTALGKIVSLLNERATTICVNHYSEFLSDLGRRDLQFVFKRSGALLLGGNVRRDAAAR